MNITAILANGTGQRFMSSVPKQFHKIDEKMVIEYVIEAAASAHLNDRIVIATNQEEFSEYLAILSDKYPVEFMEGGATRNQTLKNVLSYIAEKYPECGKLIVCDAVRPLVSKEIIDQYFRLLDAHDAVVTAQHITDSLGSYLFKEVDRSKYYLMQSPEAFRFLLLNEVFDENSYLTEVTQQLPDNASIYLNFEFVNNFKLTFPEDLVYLKAILQNKERNMTDL